MAYPYDTYEHESLVLADNLEEARDKIERFCKVKYGYKPTSSMLKKWYWDRTGYGIYG